MRRFRSLAAVLLPLVLIAVVWSWFGHNQQDGGGVDAVKPAPAFPGAGVAQESATVPAPEPENRVVDARTTSGVTVSLIRRPRIDPPAAPYGPQYEALLQAAAGGQPDAQYRLGLMLYACRDVPPDDAALAHKLSHLYQTRRIDGWDVDDPAQEERSLRQSFADCRDVPAQARLDYRKWLVQAANQGLVEAQVNLMFHLPKADYCQYIEDCTPEQARMMEGLREEARQYVSRARDAGSVEALRTMGGWALNEEMGTIDEIEAYAYFSAYDQVQQAQHLERELGAMLERLRTKLRPVDLDEAERRAAELLSNPDCCVITR